MKAGMHVRLAIPKALEEEFRLGLGMRFIRGRLLLVLFCGYSPVNSILLAWKLLCPGHSRSAFQEL